MIDELGNDLTDNIVTTLNYIREQIKQIRPQASDVNYDSKIQQYKQLVELVTDIIKNLTKIFDESLTNFRLNVEKLWNEMKNASDEQAIQQYIQEFNESSEKIFLDAIQQHLNPKLDSIEQQIKLIENEEID